VHFAESQQLIKAISKRFSETRDRSENRSTVIRAYNAQQHPRSRAITEMMKHNYKLLCIIKIAVATFTI